MKMKKLLWFLLLTIVVSLLLSASALSQAPYRDYDDIAGHWAEATLRKALGDGLIEGDNGLLYPDESITAAQALAILCRVLGAEALADIPDLGIAEDAWYYEYASKAAYLGLISPASPIDFTAPMTRGDIFCMLAEAFALVEADPDISVLGQFADSWQIMGTTRQALASLVSQGFIGGYNGKLNLDNNSTRAEFLSVIYRIINEYRPAFGTRRYYTHGVLLQGPAELSGIGFARGVWFDCAASDIRLSRVNANSAVIRSHTLDSFVLGDATYIGRLTLAAQSGDITIAPDAGSVVDTLVIGSGGGLVSVSGVDAVEVTGKGRHVVITGSVGTVSVSGPGSTVHIQEGVQVGKVALLMNAYDSRVVVDGNAEEISIASLGTAVVGGGRAETLILFRDDTEIDADYGSMVDKTDTGLSGASVNMILPNSLPAGNTLRAAAVIKNAAPGYKCSLTWYLDGKPVLDTEIVTGELPPELVYDFKYSRDFPDSAEIKVAVRYVTALGEHQEISAGSTIKLENYDKQYWMNLDAPAVLEKVTLGYTGDYTQEWAEANDLDDYDKEVWIHAKGYSSKSQYLLWINLAYQRVNIFEGSVGDWTLIRTCLVATGAPGRGTPPGVFTTSYKQLYGWTTYAYTVKPVVRFYGSVGYAFHSRLYYPYTDNIQDARIGFPMSNGCVRMYEDDIWFIYDNVPDGTTVVVH